MPNSKSKYGDYKLNMIIKMDIFVHIASCTLMVLVMRHVLPCGGFKLIFDMDQEVLWISAGDGKRKETFEVKGPLELFGFGSGDFAEGPNAQDIQSDLTGRWLAYNIKSSEELCILEADRRLPGQIKKMDLFGKDAGTCL